MSALITARGLAVTQGQTRVLHNVNFSIMRGEIVTIVGPNGSGKSSLLRALIGATPLSAGTLTRAQGLRISHVPQSLALDPTLPLTVRRFLDLPQRIRDNDAIQALETAGCSAQSSKQMTDLSGGQMQRVMLARALLSTPDLLIQDEATQGLDQPGTASFYQRIEDVRSETGCSVPMVSHDLHVVMAASDRVICLNGHICCEGHPEQVASAPEYCALFGTGTQGALALYRHAHDHEHSHDHEAAE